MTLEYRGINVAFYKNIKDKPRKAIKFNLCSSLDWLNLHRWLPLTAVEGKSLCQVSQGACDTGRVPSYSIPIIFLNWSAEISWLKQTSLNWCIFPHSN